MVPLVTSKPYAMPVANDVEQGPGKCDGVLRCTHRHDLDESGGEVIEIAIFPDMPVRTNAEIATRASAQLSPAELGGLDRVTSRFQLFADSSPSLCLRVYRHGEEAGPGMVAQPTFISAPTGRTRTAGTAARRPSSSACCKSSSARGRTMPAGGWRLTCW
jgi:hypothetical protein